jgi:hypothetical protein
MPKPRSSQVSLSIPLIIIVYRGALDAPFYVVR